MTDASLSENYIALAGAQTAVGSQTYDARYQDGLLSAREMSSLDMTGVDLIVLACCQTGLGYVTADGIYGIQRGLKNAGAGAMVVTLWEVNDKATQLFMAAFHDKMAHGTPIAEAFRQTRRLFMTREVGDDTVFVDPEESARYGIDDYFCQPRFRDAFVLIDALE
jgi:CHAT domain-containing protein